MRRTLVSQRARLSVGHTHVCEKLIDKPSSGIVGGDPCLKKYVGRRSMRLCLRRR
jgi:hypothetical protein